MTKDEALKLALSALNEVRQETFRLMRDGQTLYAEKKVWEAIYTIKEALAQPEQEPVAIRYDFDGYGYQYIDSGTGSDWQTRVQGEPLYTAPHPEQYPQIAINTEIVGYVAPKLTWVELTDEEIEELANEYLFAEGDLGMLFVGGSVEFARAILRKAKEKNS